MDYLIVRFGCAFLTGMILSQTGSFIQVSTRNILASPSTLGFDGLSVLWILLFHSFLIYSGQELSVALVFSSGIPCFILIGFFYSRFLSSYKKIEKLIFIGITFNLLVGTLFSLWQFLFLAFNLPFPVELWFGHFRYSVEADVLVLLMVEVLIATGWFWLRKEFQLFSLGESVSRNLKLKKNFIYLFIFISISIGTFAVVSLFGAFSFLGLIFPIISRKLWFKHYDLDGEIMAGSLMNGLFLMLIDSLCYFFPVYGAEIPVGLIATGVGALSLILLLWKTDNRLEILAKKGK